MKSKTTQILYAYWNDVRQNRLAPRRFEIEPARIAPILSETFILERLDDDTYRFRIAGTRICDEFGTEFRGTNFLDGWTPDDRITLTRHLQTITTQGGAGILTFSVKTATEGCVTFECILLPLIHTRDTIDRLLGGLARLEDPAATADERLAFRRLKSAEVIWPDGRPHALVASQRCQTPLLPHVRNARIVRIDRRQFRVYEGGLGKPEGTDS
ncbi:MAG: PAS domain-containing protein [Hyphomicrobiaceae bacterium]